MPEAVTQISGIQIAERIIIYQSAFVVSDATERMPFTFSAAGRR